MVMEGMPWLKRMVVLSEVMSQLKRTVLEMMLWLKHVVLRCHGFGI